MNGAPIFLIPPPFTGAPPLPPQALHNAELHQKPQDFAWRSQFSRDTLHSSPSSHPLRTCPG